MWIAVLIENKQTDMHVFQGKSAIICDIINKQLAIKKIKILGIQKITISLTSLENVNFISTPLRGVSPVVNIRKSFDFEIFKSSNEELQNEIILNLIETNLQEAANKFNWDIPKLKEITNEVRKLNFKHCYLEWKASPSKDKKNKAGVEVELAIDEARISIVFFSHDDTVIKKVHLIDVRPNRIFIKPLMGKAKWISQTDFELVDKNNEIHFKTSLLKENAEIYFTPINRDSNKVIDDLLILAVSTSNKLAIDLLKDKISDGNN